MLGRWRSESASNPWWLVAVILVAIPAPGGAQVPIQTDSIYGLRLPARIGGAERISIRDYETANPGLGYSAHYRLPGWTTDIYVYDIKLTSISDDPTSAVMTDAIAQAKNEVFRLGQRGDYKDVMLKSDYTILDSAGRMRFVCAMFTYVHIGLKGNVDSYLCMTGWKGKFVKFRMTTPQNDTSGAVSRRFIEAWSGLLWPQS